MIEAGCKQEAQYWAVAANNGDALKHLVDVENVKLDRPKLNNLAKLFDHWSVPYYVPKLKSLAWEKIKQAVPAVVYLNPEHLMKEGIAEPMVGALVKMRNTEPEPDPEPKLLLEPEPDPYELEMYEPYESDDFPEPDSDFPEGSD